MGTDLRLNSSIVDLFNNNVEEIAGTPANSSGNVALANPLFVDPFNGDYNLQFTSPLRNAGTGGYALGALDLPGSDRLNEFQFDIGAYENREVMFRDGFEAIF